MSISSSVKRGFPNFHFPGGGANTWIDSHTSLASQFLQLFDFRQTSSISPMVQSKMLSCLAISFTSDDLVQLDGFAGAEGGE